MSKPRLLVLSSTYPRWLDDPEPKFVHELSRRLNNQFEVHVLCPHAPHAKKSELLDGVMVHRFRYAPERFETLVQNGGILANLKHQPWKWLLVPFFMVCLTLFTFRFLQRIRPALLHAHWIIPQGLVLSLLSLNHRNFPPFLLTSHGGDLFGLRGRILTSLKCWVLRRASCITVVSKVMADEAIKLGIDPSRIKVISMGVDFSDRFTPGPWKARIPGEILFVGRLVEKKGVCYLLQAFPQILTQIPFATIIIVGYGPEEPKLRAMTIALGIDDKVKFLGALPEKDLPQFYRRASLFVAPFVQAKDGDQEGLGLVTVEAIACGCPVLVSDLPAVHDIFRPADEDLLCPPGNVISLAEKVVHALSNSEATAQKALDLRQHVTGRLNWKNVADEYAKTLANLIKL